MRDFAISLFALILAIFVGAFVLTLAWNAIIPVLFGAPVLDFAGAVPLLVVVFIIGRVFNAPSIKDKE